MLFWQDWLSARLDVIQRQWNWNYKFSFVKVSDPAMIKKIDVSRWTGEQSLLQGSFGELIEKQVHAFICLTKHGSWRSCSHSQNALMQSKLGILSICNQECVFYESKEIPATFPGKGVEVTVM